MRRVWYEIKYRIKGYSFVGGRGCGGLAPFPILNIRYRKTGAGRWKSLGNAEIDLYTFRRFRSTYYKDFKRMITEIGALSQKSDYERLTLFMTILKNEFDGSVEKLVKSIVREEVVMKDADTSEQRETIALTSALLTDGWKSIYIDL